MTNGQRTVTTLLVVIAVLLAINLAVTSPSHEVQAQGVGRPPEAVALIVGLEFFSAAVYRLWSDGRVERNEGFGISFPCKGVEWCGWQEIPEIPFVP